MTRNTISSFDILPSGLPKKQTVQPQAAKISPTTRMANMTIASQLPTLNVSRVANQIGRRGDNRQQYHYYRTAITPPAVRPPDNNRLQSAPVATNRTSSGFKINLMAAAILVTAGFLGTKLMTASPNQPNDSIINKIQGASPVAEVEAAADIPPVQTVDADATLGPLVNSLSEANPGMNIGVAAVDLKSGKHYQYGLDTGFVAASTAKLITAAAYYHEVEQGKRSLDTKLNGIRGQELIKSMITVSDNDAWSSLNTALTKKQLQAYAISVGLTDFNATTNTINPKDIAILLQKLYGNKLINETHTKQLLGYMKEANYTNYIPTAVPEGVTVYHKAGWLNDRVHDSAIIDDGTNSYVLVIFTKMQSGYDSTAGLDVFHKITKASLDVFLTRN